MANAEDLINAMNNQSAANSAFNAEQAQKNRDFQLYMSNTAHQREVQDLQNAGLNPILSVNSGASTGAGSTASADTSSASGYAALAQTAMNNAASITMANIAASAQTAAAGISAGAAISAANIAANSAQTVASMNNESAQQVAKINQGSNPFGIISSGLSGLTGKSNLNDFFHDIGKVFGGE